MSNSVKKQNNSVIAAAQTTDRGTSQSIPCGTGQTTAGSSLEVVRDGQVVREIHIQCNCGERTKVICAYE